MAGLNVVRKVQISGNLADIICACWDKYKKNKDNLVNVDETTTFNGIQTNNVLYLKDFKEDKVFQESLNFLWKTLQALIQEDLSYYWVHLIEYNRRGGYQDVHNHIHNEDYSAVFYLNTCRGGETYFMDPNQVVSSQPLSFSPKKSDMLVFPASYMHGARNTSSWFVNKKVLVLGLRKSSVV